MAIVAEGSALKNNSCRHAYNQTAWLGQVSLTGYRPGVAYERFTPQGPVALLPLPPEPHADPCTTQAALVWCMSRRNDGLSTLSNAQRQALLSTLFDPDIGRITALSALHAVPLSVHAQRYVVKERVVHIGNAAQTLHPVAGQGLNLGLRDAHAVVMHLARMQTQAHNGIQPNALQAHLQTLQQQRQADRWVSLLGTDFLARSFTWQLPGLDTLRSLSLAALNHCGPLKSQVARQMMFGMR
jgi:2-octaprenyl-6-methoxyphenol hydroxylase